MKLYFLTRPLRQLLTAALLSQMPVSTAFADSPAAADDSISWMSLLLPTLLILAAAAAATFVLRRWKGAVGGRDGPMQLLHVIAVGPRERLALVKVGERYLVVGIASGSVNRIAELDDISIVKTDMAGPRPPDM